MRHIVLNDPWQGKCKKWVNLCNYFFWTEILANFIRCNMPHNHHTPITEIVTYVSPWLLGVVSLCPMIYIPMVLLSLLPVMPEHAPIHYRCLLLVPTAAAPASIVDCSWWAGGTGATVHSLLILWDIVVIPLCPVRLTTHTACTHVGTFPITVIWMGNIANIIPLSPIKVIII